MKTWFITGVSRGLGKALAEAALQRGDTVIGTVRSGAPEIDSGAGVFHLLILDVADAAATEAAVEQAFVLAGGRLDVIVNNAGRGLLGAVEDTTDAEITDLFEIDVFAPFRIIRKALPRLRAQGGGHIINITSIAGRAPMPGSGFYSAAKYALEGLSASLAQEVAPLGIKVTAVAPGAFRTDFLSAHSIRKTASPSEAYAQSTGASLRRLDDMAGKQLGDPAKAAAALLALADNDHPPLHLLLGSDALHRARAKLDSMIEEIDGWEGVTAGTDFPAGE